MRQLTEIGAVVREARRRLGFHNLQELGALLGVDRRRLSAFELGLKPLDPRVLTSLSEILALPELACMAATTRGPKRREVEADFLQSARVSRPCYDPPRDRDQEVRRRAAWHEAPDLMESLEEAHRKRPDFERVRQFLSSISSLSWLEYLLPAWELADPEAVPLRLAPNEVGYCHYALLDPVTFHAVGDRLWPALGLRRGDLTLIQFFNASIRTPKRLWTVDVLQYTRRLRRPALWSVVEVDGEGHRTRWDREKEEQIALRTLRLTVEEVCLGHAWQRIESLCPP